MILFTYQTVPCVTTSLAKMSENLKKFHPLIRFKKNNTKKQTKNINFHVQFCFVGVTGLQ